MKHRCPRASARHRPTRESFKSPVRRAPAQGTGADAQPAGLQGRRRRAVAAPGHKAYAEYSKAVECPFGRRGRPRCLSRCPPCLHRAPGETWDNAAGRIPLARRLRRHVVPDRPPTRLSCTTTGAALRDAQLIVTTRHPAPRGAGASQQRASHSAPAENASPPAPGRPGHRQSTPPLWARQSARQQDNG